MEEKINTPIPDDVYAQAMEKIKSAATDLKPYLIALTSDERKKLPKMSVITSYSIHYTKLYEVHAAHGVHLIRISEYRTHSLRKQLPQSLCNHPTYLRSWLLLPCSYNFV